MNIDIHAHYVPRDSLQVAKQIGQRYDLRIEHDGAGREVVHCEGKGSFGPLKQEFYDLDLRLQLMGKAEIDKQVLSAQNFFFLYWMEPAEGLEFAQWLNDELALAAARHPASLAALATVPLQDSRLAVQELERAVKRGLRGVEIGSNINGRYFDDPNLFPFWEAAEALNVLVFVHPTNVVGADRMQDFNLGNLIGNLAETSLTFAKCIFGGVLEQFPHLKFCMAHAGGFLPYTWGRMERGFLTHEGCQRNITKSPRETMRHFYFDTIAHSQMALEYLVRNFGSDHVLLGSDYPFAMGDPEPLTSLEALTISPTEKAHIRGENTAQLLGI